MIDRRTFLALLGDGTLAAPLPSSSGSRWTSSWRMEARRRRRPRRQRPRFRSSSYPAIRLPRGFVASLSRPGGNLTGVAIGLAMPQSLLGRADRVIE